MPERSTVTRAAATNGPTTPQDILRAAAQHDRTLIQPGDALGFGLAGMPERFQDTPPGHRRDEEEPTHFVVCRFGDGNDRKRKEPKKAGNGSEKKKAAKKKKEKKDKDKHGKQKDNGEHD